MIKKTTTCLLLIISALFLNGCKDVCDCFKSTGPMSSEDRDVADFTYITASNNVDVIIHPATYNHIKVNAGSHLISEITTSVENGTLNIKNKNKCNWVRDFHPTIQVEVWEKDITGILFKNSTGNLYMTDSITGDNFRFDAEESIGIYNMKLNVGTATLAINDGPSDLTASGKANVAYLYSVGFGKVDCIDFVVGDIYMNNKGTNSNYVNVINRLEATIMGSGNIYYKGNPTTLKENIIGSGQLIQLQ